MRYPVALFTFLALVAFLGCSSKTKLPPVSPEDVQVLMLGQEQPPTGSYVVVWQASDYPPRFGEVYGSYNRYPRDWTYERIIEHLKGKAAKNGADALLMDSMRELKTHKLCDSHRSFQFLSPSER